MPDAATTPTPSDPRRCVRVVQARHQREVDAALPSMRCERECAHTPCARPRPGFAGSPMTPAFDTMCSHAVAAAAAAAAAAPAPAAAALGAAASATAALGAAAPATAPAAATVACAATPALALTSDPKSLSIPFNQIVACQVCVEKKQSREPLTLWVRAAGAAPSDVEVRLCGNGPTLCKEHSPTLATVALTPKHARALVLNCSQAGSVQLSVFPAGSETSVLSITINVLKSERLSPVSSAARTLFGQRKQDGAAVPRYMDLLLGESDEAQAARTYVDALMAEGGLPDEEKVFEEIRVGAVAAAVGCSGCPAVRWAASCPARRCRRCCEMVHGSACAAHAPPKKVSSQAGAEARGKARSKTGKAVGSKQGTDSGEGAKQGGKRAADDADWQLDAVKKPKGKVAPRPKAAPKPKAPPKQPKQPTAREFGRALVGHNVRKTFDGMGCFDGSVTKYRPIKKVWEVEYRFNDNREESLEEEVAWEELQTILLSPTSGEGDGAECSDDGGGAERSEGAAGAECGDGGGSDDAECDCSDGGNAEECEGAGEDASDGDGEGDRDCGYGREMEEDD